jgi:ubiquinone/menaquinone biosynthesis C-methylase UbiE
MSPASKTYSSPAEFAAVDAAGDPAALIEFMDAAGATSGLTAARRALLDRLALGNAAAALDVGCGFGADVAAMVRRMPPGARAAGVDVSEAMIAEARRRTASLGGQVSFQTGDASSLPYPDGEFDVCRAATVLMHVPDPARVVSEMARVTRSGGRVGVLEFDEGTLFLDHPDAGTTQRILDTFRDAKLQGRIGRQVPRLLRRAGLSDVSVTPLVNMGGPALLRMMLSDHVARLQEQGLLTGEQARRWWAELDEQAQAGDFLGGAVMFVVTASKPTRHAGGADPA